MDFVERYLHIIPDGGSGATEAIYIAVVVLIALALVLRRELRKHPPGTAAVTGSEPCALLPNPSPPA
jgi:hypothetical protein